ncbi:MAG TPA: aldolase/citrate lyase family protein [Candidatus Polarisedimenticolia bacterium]|nr:aldolase/citrate lyase family protein [Candidatus Polarisedimenticolia bacterium]
MPGFQHFHATRVLDGGALGVVVPHVDDAETARKMVDNCRYPPVGHRSVTGRLPQFGFAPVPLAESTKLVNEATLLVVMLETPTAVENCESIAAVDGVDVLLMGTNDLCMEMGIPGQVGDPKIAGIFERVVAACRAHGKWAGLGGVYEPGLMQKYIGLGMQFILMGNDLPLLMEITAQRTTQLRELKQ